MNSEKTDGSAQEQYKVLMVDDDEVIAESTAEYFNMFDVKTAYVTSYDAAIANGEVSIASRPESSAVYVYSRYGEVLYSTHVVDASATLPMPKGGKIVFLGEDGGSVELN